MSDGGARRITIEIEDPADAEARAAALAVIAIRLQLAGRTPTRNAGACCDLIHAAARIARHQLNLSEQALVAELTNAAEFSARVVCSRDPDGTEPPPRRRDAPH